MEACHLLLICQRRVKKIPNFLILINTGPQLELSYSLLLELMNAQKHIIILPKDQLYRGKGTLLMSYIDVCQQEEIRSLGHFGFSLMEKQTGWHYRATSLPSPDPFPGLSLEPLC